MKNKKGFTLVELLATIVILSILLVSATPLVFNAIKKSKKDAKCKVVTDITVLYEAFANTYNKRIECIGNNNCDFWALTYNTGDATVPVILDKDMIDPITGETITEGENYYFSSTDCINGGESLYTNNKNNISICYKGLSDFAKNNVSDLTEYCN